MKIGDGDKRGCSEGKHPPLPNLRLWFGVSKRAKRVGDPREGLKKEKKIGDG